MKIVHRLAALSALLLLPAAAAQAADKSGPGYVRMVLDASARCLLDDRANSVQRFLSLAPDSKDAVRHARYLNASECIVTASRGQDIVFSAPLLRGAFYRELYVRAFEKSTPGLRPGPVAVGAADAGVASLAECLVRKAPNTARTLVLAPVESELEAKAFQALYDRVGTCSPAPSFSKAMLTGVIAETLFKLSDSSATSGTKS